MMSRDTSYPLCPDTVPDIVPDYRIVRNGCTGLESVVCGYMLKVAIKKPSKESPDAR